MPYSSRIYLLYISLSLPSVHYGTLRSPQAPSSSFRDFIPRKALSFHSFGTRPILLLKPSSLIVLYSSLTYVIQDPPSPKVEVGQFSQQLYLTAYQQEMYEKHTSLYSALLGLLISSYIWWITRLLRKLNGTGKLNCPPHLSSVYMCKNTSGYIHRRLHP